MTATVPQPTPIEFTAPGPGSWELDSSHRGLRPVSPILREAFLAGADGFSVVGRSYGLALAGVSAELVNGCLYIRPLGVGERPGAKVKPPPPTWLMAIVARVHPEMRRRNRTAANAWRDRLWRTEVDRWFHHDRAALVARNRELQAVDLAALDDAALMAHLRDLVAHFSEQARRNLETHGGDLIPVGDLLAHCEQWGISAAEAAELLRGSSPAAVETAELLAPVARAVRSANHVPASVDDIRALDDDARAAVDEWYAIHSWRLVTSDDVDRPTLAEMPGVVLSLLLAAQEPQAQDEPDSSMLRNRVPAEQRALFDALVGEARYGLRQRDDIRGVCWNWPGGLVRRALMEAGARLAARGLLHTQEHVVELSPGELAGLLTSNTGPSADDLARRAAWRDAVEAAPPPRTLGEPESPPPFAALPTPMRRATMALLASLMADGTAPASAALHGTGIGTSTYRGRACVVTDDLTALERLEPGDVLVARCTGPAFNSIVPLLGALVVEEGGAMCHAAIVAREFGLPAVIGAAGATTGIVDGAHVEVDAATGAVTLV